MEPKCTFCKGKRYYIEIIYEPGGCRKIVSPCPECNKEEEEVD